MVRGEWTTGNVCEDCKRYAKKDISLDAVPFKTILGTEVDAKKAELLNKFTSKKMGAKI
jgi:hypothetical protein